MNNGDHITIMKKTLNYVNNTYKLMVGPYSDANGRPVMTRAEAGVDYDYRNEDERRWQLEQRERAMKRPRPGTPLHLRKNKYRQPWR